MKTALIFGIVALTANFLFVMYSKRKAHSSKKEGLPNLFAHAQGHSTKEPADDEVRSLLERSSKELNVSVDELMRMSAEQIERLAKKKLLHAKIEVYQKERTAIEKNADDQQNDNRIDP